MGYKRSELKIHKDGYYDLAKAVIKQWRQDGEPRGDKPTITLWAELIESHQSNMINRRVGVRRGSYERS
jgi:hypothetical protein